MLNRRSPSPVLLPVALALAGCATLAHPRSPRASGATPAFRRVHIDHVAPDRVDTFESARKGWLAALAARHLTEPTARVFQVDGTSFFTIAPFKDFADLDAQRAALVRLDADAGVETVEAYQRPTHASLVPPHASEIWSYEPDASYRPAGSTLDEMNAGFALMMVEQIAPSRQGDYEKAWGQVRDALAAIHYPLARVSFSSLYGTGELISFWLAPSESAFAAEPNVREALAQALGPERSAELLADLDGCLARARVTPAVPRDDLSSR